MTILICSNLLSGATGLDKSVVMTANGLHRAGYHVVVLNFLGSGDGSSHILSRWEFDEGIPVRPLQTLAARGGRLLHRGYHPVRAGRIGAVAYSFTENELAALRQLNAAMEPDDTIVFTHPIQAVVFQEALGHSSARRPRTVLQVHGDFLSETTDLWDTMLAGREVIDRVQTVADGMRHQFVPTFAPDDVVWIPNIQEPGELVVEEHDGVNIALVGSFQSHKNQIDAVRALAQIPEDEVRLTLWGVNTNAYGEEVRALTASLGMDERVRMPGVGSENDLYGATDIVVMPSASEGFPYVISEATCHGIPIVAYDFDFGPRDAIEDGRSGFIVPQGDVDQLAERLRRLAVDPDLRERFGRASRGMYDRKLSAETIMASYRALLGEGGRTQLMLDSEFPDGTEPVEVEAISHRFRRVGRQRRHIVTVRSEQALYNLQIDNGKRRRTPRSVRLRDRTIIVFGASGNEVVSYAVAPGSDDRHYLGNTTSKNGFEVLRYLRRDADDGERRPGSSDAVRAPIRNAPPVREIARHPRMPVIGGVDSFGARLNLPGGVVVRNNGTATRPRVRISGEYDWVDLRDARSVRRVESPFRYGELFERLCEIERDHGLFDITTREGVHAWELYRGVFVSHICEALGLWGTHFGQAAPSSDVYVGPKRLGTAPRAHRVLFEFPRKPPSGDLRTRRFVDDDTLVIEYPQQAGYSAAVHDSALVYPIHEYNHWRRSSRRPSAARVDQRPFEAALSAGLGIEVTLGDQLTSRVQKFLDEREFWTPVFERVQPEEVVIPSSHWSAGICAAAERVGARTSDVQYALTGRYHPSYWFGDRPRHGAKQFYSWSSFWSPRVNGYQSTVVAPRYSPELQEAAQILDRSETEWDVCVVSQPRIFRRVVAFLIDLVRSRPGVRVVIAPHPDEREAMPQKLAAAGLRGRVAVATSGTLETIARSEICVGGYSTSLFEAAALGRPTYILPVPGHELMLQDVRAGLFRLATEPDDLVPFEVPAAAASIFGQTAELSTTSG